MASPSRTVMRRFSEDSAIVAPPVQDLDGAFQTMVVRDASTSPVAFSRTVASPPKQRTNSRPPSAPLIGQWASANSSAWVQSTTKAKPFCASHSRPRPVGEMPSSRLKERPTRVAGDVVEVAAAARPSTPTSAALCRKAAARRFGTPPSARTSRDVSAQGLGPGGGRAVGLYRRRRSAAAHVPEGREAFQHAGQRRAVGGGLDVLAERDGGHVHHAL
jgi:hypothetical protein